MTTPTEAERVAMGLTKAAKRALLECTPWDVEVSAGVAIAFCANGLLEDSTIVDDGVQLSDLGLQVRAALSQEDV